MNGVFLDASAWYAAVTSKDGRHAVARKAYESSASAGHRLVTTHLVIAEVHALVLKWRGPRLGQRFIDLAFEAGTHTIVPVDVELVDAALTRWVRRFADQDFSLCDAVSFEVMRRERITRALTFDHHFAVAGFETLR